MHILNVGVNYQIASVEIRENLLFSESELPDAILALSEQESILENIILSTCNRTELFTVVESIERGKEVVIQFLKNWFHLSEEELENNLQFKYDDAAIEHAFKLAVGLDSMVLGETEILGQVRDAFLMAQKFKTTDKVFNELFKRIITFAKGAHSNTAIGEHAVSISYIAVELAKKQLGKLKGKRAVILGAGEMSERSLRNLQAAGVTEIAVVNRTIENAQKLATKFNIQAFPMNALSRELVKADMLISSTSAREVIVTKEQLEHVQTLRESKPLLLIDIAVPRDIDSDIKKLPNLSLYDVDDLHDVVDGSMEARKEAARLIESQLPHELVSFQNWLNTRNVVPLIQALREKSIDIQERTLDSIFRKIPDLDEREKKVLYKHTMSLVNQLINQPIKHVKKMANTETNINDKNQFIEMFGLEDYLAANDNEKTEVVTNNNRSMISSGKR